MKKSILAGAILAAAVLGLAQVGLADQGKRGRPQAGRQKGNAVGHTHIIKHTDGHEVVHPVVSDHRPLKAIHGDKTLVRVKLGFFPEGHVEHRWDHWHRDWGQFWRFEDWTRINQVTCEAVNTSNSYLYPVTGYRTDYPTGWSNDTANQLVEVALDNCYSESQQIGASPDDCVLVDWGCRYL